MIDRSIGVFNVDNFRLNFLKLWNLFFLINVDTLKEKHDYRLWMVRTNIFVFLALFFKTPNKIDTLIRTSIATSSYGCVQNKTKMDNFCNFLSLTFRIKHCRN